MQSNEEHRTPRPSKMGLALRCIAVAGLALSPVALTACNTVEGAGEDIEAAGDGISDASRDVRD